jgi:hypothetical protein
MTMEEKRECKHGLSPACCSICQAERKAREHQLRWHRYIGGLSEKDWDRIDYEYERDRDRDME